MDQEAWKEANKIVARLHATKPYEKYQNEPVAFCQDVFNDRFTTDMEKVMYSVRDTPVTVARSGNALGKSYAAAKVALWVFTCFSDSKVFITSAPPLENLRRILWGHIMSAVHSRKDIYGNYRIKVLDIIRHDESFISGVTIPTTGHVEAREARFSGKHSPHILFIVDEGDAVPDEVYRGIESCMSGGWARLLIMFNPRFAAGSVYLKELNHQANVIELSAMNHPNVITGKDYIPGAVTREMTVRRINEWTRSATREDKMSLDSFEIPKFLEYEVGLALDGRLYPPLLPGKRIITEPSFSYMVLGKYPSQSEMQLISLDWIEAAIQRGKEYAFTFGSVPPANIQPIMGVDIAEMGTDSNVACLRYNDYVAPFIVWRGVDPDMTSNKALELCRQYHPFITNIDAMGAGSSVAPAMMRRARASKEQLTVVAVRVSEKPLAFIKTELGEFYQLRDQLWWALREWLRTSPTAMLPNDVMLREELKTPTFTTMETTGKIKILAKERLRDLLKRSPDKSDALCLTFMPQIKAKVLKLTHG